MKSINVNRESLLKDIERANRKENFLKLLGILLTVNAGLTVVELGILKETIESSKDPSKVILEMIRNNLLFTSTIGGIKAYITRMISYKGKVNLEKIIDGLETEKIFTDVESLQEATIIKEEDETLPIDYLFKDRRNNLVKLREFFCVTGTIDEYDIELIETLEDEKTLTLN